MKPPPDEVFDVERETIEADTLDAAALLRIREYRAGELPRVRAQAQKWLTATTAITGVLATATVVGGGRDFSELGTSAILVGLLLVSGGVLIGGGTWYAYSAAFGRPAGSRLDLVASAQKNAHGAAHAWAEAVSAEASAAKDDMRKAGKKTILGTGLLAVAVMITWLTPEPSSAGRTPPRVCVSIGGDYVAFVEAPAVVSGTLDFVPCP